MSEKTQFNEQMAALAAAVSKFSREELEMMVVKYFDVIQQIRSVLPAGGKLMLSDIPQEVDKLQEGYGQWVQVVNGDIYEAYRGLINTSEHIPVAAYRYIRLLEARAADLGQQVVELSKDKARLSFLIFLRSGRFYSNGMGVVYLGKGMSSIDAIDDAMKQEQEHE